jgi:hypothetical protein
MLKEAQINSKAAFVKEQINDRISKGATILEMQLLGELKENKEIDINLVGNIDVCAIHMPLINGTDSVIEQVDGREYFKKACKLASDIAEIKNHNIIVVLHTSMQILELKALGLYDVVVNVIRGELDKYPNIEIAIENTATHDYRRESQIWTSNNTLSFENGKMKMANVELAKNVNHERCGTCFDTCHAIMNENNLKHINFAFENFIEEIYGTKSLFDIMFEQSAPIIKLIHLAYAEGNGFNELHGLPFSDNNFSTLLHIDNLYRKHNLNCPVTVEVYEKDINNALNYVITQKTINKL